MTLDSNRTRLQERVWSSLRSKTRSLTPPTFFFPLLHAKGRESQTKGKKREVFSSSLPSDPLSSPFFHFRSSHSSQFKRLPRPIPIAGEESRIIETLELSHRDQSPKSVSWIGIGREQPSWIFASMESLWKLTYLLEPASVTLIATAVFVTYASASRALAHSKEMERNRDVSEASITLDRSQALMIPLISSCSLLLMFYLFSSVSQLLTAFTAIASASAIFFCLSPYVAYAKSQLGFVDPFVSRCCSKSFTRSQGLLLLACVGIVCAWLISGHWILNNLLGICICIAFVSHVRLPNIKICALLLICLFVYDVFWVFFSERFFGENVMVSVATQQASNPVHTVADSLSLPGVQMITKKLELPVKLVFPRNLLGGAVPEGTRDYMMLGLGDMAIPSMLLALVLIFDNRKARDIMDGYDASFSKGPKYIWYALPGYAIGLVVALAAGILTHSPQPALLYLVPSTLGPVVFISWIRNELMELWEGTTPISTEKTRLLEI